jgi:hypothetical protein
MTLGNMRSIGCRSVKVTCGKCRHEAVVNCDRWPDEMPAPDVELYLRCSQCGSKDVRSRLHMAEVYAKAFRSNP